MELSSFIPASFDAMTSIIILIITFIVFYWFWLKPRLSSSTKPDDIIKTIKNIQAYVYRDFLFDKNFQNYYFLIEIL